MLNIQVPPGRLKVEVAGSTDGRVFVAALQPNSPMVGKLFPGDCFLTINKMPVTSRDACVSLFQSTAASSRTVCISRAVGGSIPFAAAKQSTNSGKENTGNTKLAAASSKVQPVTDTATLLGLTAAQLKEQLQARGLTPGGRPTKDAMLERLGVPETWKKWRKLKIVELKPILQSRGLTVGGTKQEMLTRLGVPVGFGETKHETWMREERERSKKRKRKLKALSHQVIQQPKKNFKSPHEDPTHEEYEIPCCSSPRFPRGEEPSGMILFPDGSMMEVWRCAACGKIPGRPNAPPIIEDTESDVEEYQREFCGPFGFASSGFPSYDSDADHY